MSFLREVPRYLHISRYINMLSTSTHYLRISPGGGGRGEEHGDGGAGVRGADPHGRGQVSRGLRHPARQAQGGPGGHRASTLLNSRETVFRSPPRRRSCWRGRRGRWRWWRGSSPPSCRCRSARPPVPPSPSWSGRAQLTSPSLSPASRTSEEPSTDHQYHQLLYFNNILQ